MERTLTQGMPYKQIVKFAAPLLLGNIIQQLYYKADVYIVAGHLL
ncbi:hypothetical protein [Priestia megaterium]